MGFPPAAVSRSGKVKQALFRAPFLAPSSGYGGKQRYPKKDCLVAQVAAEFHRCFKSMEDDHMAWAAYVRVCRCSCQCIYTCYVTARPSPQDLKDDTGAMVMGDDINDLRVNLIEVKESCATSTSLSRPNFPRSSGKT